MKMHLSTKHLASLILALVVLSSTTITYAIGSGNTTDYSSFKQRSQLLTDQEESSLSLDQSSTVIVNKNKLAKKKIKAEDATFLQELADFSNDVTAASKTQEGINGAGRKLVKYPLVQKYFNQAHKFAQEGQTLSLQKKPSYNPLTSFAIVGSPVGESLGMADCGIYWSPKPGVAKNWVYMNVNNADATLRSWGYHPTINQAGGGWTRAQTWHPWNCGWATFRDHALIDSYYRLHEQNYNGWNPRGEPNPEVYASGPWPYTTWPAYVYWWHNTH